MINSLEVNNFQSHKHSELEFHKGVNVIVGPSDSGKSALLRSLKYVLFNSLKGDYFRSHWGGDTSVNVKVDNFKITRMRSAKENKYVLDGSEFKAVKTDVPVEISNILNISDLNLQQQIDGPFLINKTPGEVAKFFNKIANFDKIDLSISNIKSWIAKKTATLSVKEQDFETATENLKKFAYLGEFEEGVVVVEKLQAKLDLKEAEYNTLLSATIEIQETTAELVQYTELLKCEADVDAIIALIEKKGTLLDSWEILDLAVGNIESVQFKIDKQSKLVELEPLLIEITKLSDLHDSKLDAYDALQDIVTSIKSVETEIVETDDLYERLHAEFEAKMPDVCPLCSQKIHK